MYQLLKQTSLVPRDWLRPASEIIRQQYFMFSFQLQYDLKWCKVGCDPKDNLKQETSQRKWYAYR